MRPRSVVLKTTLLNAGLALLMVSAPACSRTDEKPSSAPSAADAQPTQGSSALWGDMKPVVSVKELMRDMIDPASDYVFDSIGTVVTKGQRHEVAPKTDADWDRIRIGGVMMAEGAYLLKVPRPFTPPGDENNSTGPDAEELSPAQIKAKLEHDPVLWNAKIEALRNVGLEVMDIAKRRDVNQLWEACDNLDHACEGCHLEYWYPGEGEYLRKLDRRLDELYGSLRPGRTAKLGMDPK